MPLLKRKTVLEKPPSRRFARDRLEHLLYVVRRTGDDLQYLGRRRLLLAGFLQVFAQIRDRTRLTSAGGRCDAALCLGRLAAFSQTWLADFRLLCLAARL
jgi:hypothetical protein